jgi:integrase
MRTWSAEQLAAFLEYTASDRLHTLWLLASTTAMRRAELLGLSWENVDLAARRLSVRWSRTSVGYVVEEGAPKSRRGTRVLDLDPIEVADLRRWRKRQLEERVAWGEAWTDSGLVFTHEDGTGLHPDATSDTFDRVLKPSGLPKIRFHDLRHTWATLTLRAGVSPKIVSERLGHATVAFTMDVYAHAIAGWGADAAATFARLVFGKGE